MNGANFYTGLVIFPLESKLGGYCASIRVVQGVFIELPNKKKFELQGFIISIFSNLRYVQTGQYAFHPLVFGPGPVIPENNNNKKNDKQNDESKKNDDADVKLPPLGPGPVISTPKYAYPKYWKPIEGDTLKCC